MLRVQTQRVTCRKCSHVSEIEMVVGGRISLFTESIKNATCSNCGADSNHLLLGGSIPEPDGISDLSLNLRLEWWLANGDVGTSSKTIAFCLSGKHMGQAFRPDIPHDPADFNRCVKLLKLIPEWRGRLTEVADAHPEWSAIVTRWEEFERLLHEEAPSGSGVCSELYDRMKEIGC